MASATQRITLSAGWQKIAEAKGREAMALIDAYGAVQLAIADGEPPRGDVANGHALNGSMMWPVRGAEIVWARGNGVAVSVTLLKVVPEFATLDSAAVKVAAASAKVTATAADAKATQAQEVQARRDFAVWHLVDYLHPDDMTAALAGDTDGQNETRVTAALRVFHDEFIDWWNGGNGRIAKLVYPALSLAVNDEVQSEHFAQRLWDMAWGFALNRIDIEFNGVRFQTKNWATNHAVRTSGFYAAQGITGPVPKAVYRWEQPSSQQFCPQVRGRLYITGSSDPATDPIGFKAMRWNTANLDRVYVRDLANYGVFIENMFNSSVPEMEIATCGYQPTDFGGTGHMPVAVRFSNVGAVVTASEAIFDADHVGKWFFLPGAGPSRYGTRQIHMATIASVDSPTQITLTSAPDTDVSAAVGSFEAVRGSITAGSNVLTLTAPVSVSLVGRYITVMRCGQQGVTANHGAMTARIVAHSGDQVTLSHNARLTVTDAAVSIASGLFLGRSADAAVAGLDLNDDVTFDNLRIENASNSTAVCAVLGASSSVDFSPGSKFHGSAPNYNNFASNFACVVYDNVTGLRLNSCIVTHGGHSPRFGRHMFGGGRIDVEITGDEADFNSGIMSASIYNDIQSGPTSANIYYGATRSTGMVANQVLARYGANGQASQIRAFNSHRTAKQGDGRAELPTYLDGLNLRGSVAGDAFSRDGYAGDPTAFTIGKVMLAGYGGNTGASQSPLASDLNTFTQAHRRGRFNAGATNAPWTSQGGIFDVIYNGSSVVQVAWSVGFNGQRRAATRHNNTTGNVFTAWTPLHSGNSGTTAQRPTDPLMAETYHDTTLGLPILWNGTAWIDYVGTAV